MSVCMYVCFDVCMHVFIIKTLGIKDG